MDESFRRPSILLPMK